MITQIGQKLTLTYEDREFEVIVIDPHGLGFNQPLIGFGFRMAERHIGLPEPTLSHWTMKESVIGTGSVFETLSLKLPFGKRLELIQLLGIDNREYVVIEASLWVELVKDVLKKPGQLRKATKDKLIDFLAWFAVKGLYAEAYTALRGKYTQADSQALSEWLSARMDGIPVRKKYTTFLTQQGCYKFYHLA